MKENDTIFAPITLIGNSAVSVIRISGKDTLELLKKITSIKSFEHRRVYVDYIKQKNLVYEHAVISLFLSPNSYTGEDMAEVSIHGGIASYETFSKLLKSNGIREANRGEFTRRAFLNGKIDLVQAESILQIVNAKNETSLFLSLKNERGEFSKKILQIKEYFLNLKSYVQSSIDFPDDVFWSYEEFFNELSKLKDIILKLKKTINSGRIINKGIKMVLVGRSNTGKSTLFNRLVKEERAIVSETKGTTRDFISEWIDMDGIPVNIIDGCGIRDTDDPVEKKGIELLFQKIDLSDIVIFLYDLSEGFTAEDEKILKTISFKKPIIVGNKLDIAKRNDGKGIKLSALTGENIELLNKEILKRLDFSDQTLVVSDHQYNVLNNMFQDFERIENLKDKNQPEIIDFYLKEILDNCDILLGKITDENILDKIFSKFCIGK